MRVIEDRKRKNIFNDAWVWKMAWRDARGNFSRLFLFLSAIIIGIAALVAINSFHINLQEDIDSQARELLGSDFVIDGKNPFEDEIIKVLDSLGLEEANETNFASMILFKHSGETRLIRVIALSGPFPFYGNVQTSPEEVFDVIQEGPFAVIDENLASQYNVSTNDTIKVGKMDFIVKGEVIKIPGGGGLSSTFTPSIYISKKYLDSTRLVQYGSRVNYKKYFKTGSDAKTEELREKLRPVIRKYGHDIETVESQKEDLGEGLANLYKFFNLLAFVALILGCLGIASSVHIYAREKKQSVAILRCLGASGWQSFNIYMIQTVISGLFGSILGIILGVLIQFGLPSIISGFVPIDINVSLSGFTIAEGLALGFVISVLFSVVPLTSVRFVPPLSVIRTDFEPIKRVSKLGVTAIVLSLLFPFVFASYQTRDFYTGFLFFAGLLIAFTVLYFVAKLIMNLFRKYFPVKLGFVWRQSFSNLYRPNNQTSVMVVVVGLGAFLIATMHIVQTSLLNQVEFVGTENQSNTILFDIQPNQKEGVVKLTSDNGLDVQQLVPIVTCRIEEVRGKTVNEIQEDTTDNISNWAITREYRVTYRDSLHISENLVEGKVQEVLKTSNGSDSILITLSQGVKDNLDAELGDKIIFDIQGVPVTTYIGGFREVDWPRDPPNFIVVFPPGVLEKAPQIYVLATRVDAKTVADRFSRQVVAMFPNVSIIDLRLIISTINQFFSRVSFIINFLAYFSIITGLIVLASAVINSKFARLKENVLLRTLGAVTKQIVGITVLEYFYLGVISSFAGIMLALVAGWGLSIFVFDIIFLPELWGLFFILLGITGLTILVGWINTRDIISKPPIEILRNKTY